MLSLERLGVSARRSRLALAALLLSACTTAVNPVTGERETLVLSPAQEASAGKQAAEEVRQQIGLACWPSPTPRTRWPT